MILRHYAAPPIMLHTAATAECSERVYAPFYRPHAAASSNTSRAVAGDPAMMLKASLRALPASAARPPPQAAAPASKTPRSAPAA